MIKPPKPIDEAERLAALIELQILDTPAEERFDKITELIAKVCGTEFCVISLVDEERQWFKSKVGLSEDSTSRDVSFCGHAILEKEILEVNNAILDPRFKENPLVTGEPNVRFYAGAPLITQDGYAVGTLCVFDRNVKVLETFQREALRTFANKIINLLQDSKRNSKQ